MAQFGHLLLVVVSGDQPVEWQLRSETSGKAYAYNSALSDVHLSTLIYPLTDSSHPSAEDSGERLQLPKEF